MTTDPQRPTDASGVVGRPTSHEATVGTRNRPVRTQLEVATSAQTDHARASTPTRVSRRTALKALGSVLLFGDLAGCIEETYSGGDSPASTEPATPTATRTPVTTTEPTPEPEHYEVTFARCTFLVEFGCERLAVEPSRPDVQYSLTLQYRDRETGERLKFATGPLTGRTEDVFDGTGLVLVEVVIDVALEGAVALHVQRGCVDYDGPLLELHRGSHPLPATHSSSGGT